MRWGITAAALLLTTSLLLPRATWAEEPETDWLFEASPGASTYSLDADKYDSDFNHSSGEITTRFGVDFDTVAGFGADGTIDLPEDFSMGFSGGIGYFPMEQVSADIDLSTALAITEAGADISTFTITPGSHVYPIPQLFLHAGLPITPTNDPMTLSILGGVGYEVPVGDNQNLIGEAAITYPLTGDVPGTVTLGGGYAYSF